jgi:hypothetical protein
MVLIAVILAFVFMSGITSILTYFSRELVVWKRDRWRFRLGQLLMWMALIAFGLALLRVVVLES